MIYANSLINGIKTKANETGERAKCPICNNTVISKCGAINIKHWAHQTLIDCDTWAYSETEWHLNWKSLFPKENVEVTIAHASTYHRADIIGKDGTIIELQHSPICVDAIRDREKFYGKMIWIFDLSDFRLAFNIEKDIPLYSLYEPGLFVFKWKWARPSVCACKMPIYFDYSMNLLLRVKLLVNSYGVGSFIEKNQLLSEFRSDLIDKPLPPL